MTNPPTGAGIPHGGSPDHDATLWYQRRPTAILLTAERTNGQCSVVLGTERPGSEPPRHRHQHEDETCYVLAGTLTYHVGDELLQASAGTCVFLPRGIDHTFVVHSPEARVLTFYTPGGFEGYVREMSVPHPGAGAHAGAAHEVERMIAVAARYGCEITGPPPANRAQATVDGRHHEAACGGEPYL